jgi:Rieske Fe-S protein
VRRKPEDPDRRRFGQAAALLLVGAAGSSAGCGAGESLYNGGPAASVAAGDASLVPIPNAQTYVCRDVGGLYALSAYCTHAHCVLQFDPAMGSAPAGFVCNCHGSTFDYNGQGPTPPAASPLQHYRLVVDQSGKMFIDPATVVDPATRTKG